jgi:hypothetical protein
VEGNGTPAITIQVATMDTRLSALETERNDSKVPRHVTIGLVVSVVLAAFGILAGFVQG